MFKFKFMNKTEMPKPVNLPGKNVGKSMMSSGTAKYRRGGTYNTWPTKKQRTAIGRFFSQDQKRLSTVELELRELRAENEALKSQNDRLKLQNEELNRELRLFNRSRRSSSASGSTVFSSLHSELLSKTIRKSRPPRQSNVKIIVTSLQELEVACHKFVEDFATSSINYGDFLQVKNDIAVNFEAIAEIAKSCSEGLIEHHNEDGENEDTTLNISDDLLSPVYEGHLRRLKTISTPLSSCELISIDVIKDDSHLETPRCGTKYSKSVNALEVTMSETPKTEAFNEVSILAMNETCTNEIPMIDTSKIEPKRKTSKRESKYKSLHDQAPTESFSLVKKLENANSRKILESFGNDKNVEPRPIEKFNSSKRLSKGQGPVMKVNGEVNEKASKPDNEKTKAPKTKTSKETLTLPFRTSSKSESVVELAIDSFESTTPKQKSFRRPTSRAPKHGVTLRRRKHDVSLWVEHEELRKDDFVKLLTLKAHIGTTRCDHKMLPYVFERTKCGVNIIDISKTWEKIRIAAMVIAALKNPEDLLVTSQREQASRGILKFSEYTGAQYYGQRWTPGMLTNQITKNFIEPQILLVSCTVFEKQAIREAAFSNIPVIALCSTDSSLKYVDVCIPCNNKTTESIGLIYWMLAREVLYIRGMIPRGQQWKIFPDVFFPREQSLAGPENPEDEEEVGYVDTQDQYAQQIPEFTRPYDEHIPEWNANLAAEGDMVVPADGILWISMAQDEDLRKRAEFEASEEAHLDQKLRRTAESFLTKLLKEEEFFLSNREIHDRETEKIESKRQDCEEVFRYSRDLRRIFEAEQEEKRKIELNLKIVNNFYEKAECNYLEVEKKLQAGREKLEELEEFRRFHLDLIEKDEGYLNDLREELKKFKR